MLVCSYSSYPRGWVLLPISMGWGPVLKILVPWDHSMIGLNLSIARGPGPPAFRVLAPSWTSGVISAGLNQTQAPRYYLRALGSLSPGYSWFPSMLLMSQKVL